MPDRLLDESELERSAVVANCRMNRARRLGGRGGYEWELGVDVVGFLEWRARTRGSAAWLDLCCGEGRALIDAADRFTAQGMAVEILGVDLVDAFAPSPPGLRGLQRVVAALPRWAPARQYDLITCVHGLHYVGDKLALIAQMASWLVDDGRMLGHLDLANVVLRGGSARRRIPPLLRAAGVEHDRQLVRCEGRREVRLPLTYLGADDSAGPNYTGQLAVSGVYMLTG
ncbi:MAG: SAM-dependent methyltransferase [Myxococcota bacterium]|jgi:SAM-dependent methyltransferase